MKTATLHVSPLFHQMLARHDLVTMEEAVLGDWPELGCITTGHSSGSYVVRNDNTKDNAQGSRPGPAWIASEHTILAPKEASSVLRELRTMTAAVFNQWPVQSHRETVCIDYKVHWPLAFLFWVLFHFCFFVLWFWGLSQGALLCWASSSGLSYTPALLTFLFLDKISLSCPG